MSTLRSFSAWEQSVRNFAWLHDSVSGAMDIDMLVERKGNFLVIEGKPWHSKGGIVLPYGQNRALTQLSALPKVEAYLLGETGGEEVYVARFGEGNKPSYWHGSQQIYWPAKLFTRSTKHAVRMMAQDWWRRASDE